MMETQRRPAWLRKETDLAPLVVRGKSRIAGERLHTVCESARCPNLSECFKSGNATFLIMGDRCTRDCAFCAVDHGAPAALDPEEGMRIARHVREAGVRYVVITSVTRDDLPDGGGGHFARVVRDIRAVLPDLGIELLVPDFQGDAAVVAAAAALPIEVFGHNLETVPSLYPRIRRGAGYERSLEVLRVAGEHGTVRVKTGVMVGLGETAEELHRVFDDCAKAGVGILTIGQYLRPSWRNTPVERWVPPDEFDRLAEEARRRGIHAVQAGPYVRSSYLAEEVARRAAAAASGRS
jgi:lipoyl synthase